MKEVVYKYTFDYFNPFSIEDVHKLYKQFRSEKRCVGIVYTQKDENGYTEHGFSYPPFPLDVNDFSKKVTHYIIRHSKVPLVSNNAKKKEYDPYEKMYVYTYSKKFFYSHPF
jgi:hypothetical protein